MDENEELNRILETEPPRAPATSAQSDQSMQAPVQVASQMPGGDFTQWRIEPNDCFRASGHTTPELPVGVYRFADDQYGTILQRVKVVTDKLMELPDMAGERLLAGMRKFWNSEQRYKDHGLLYKRGVLMWGPPGGGKTATLGLLMNELMAAGGIVVLVEHPRLATCGLEQLRRIEPKRRLICVLEDIDELIDRYGEHLILALLDGENQVGNIVNIATTNYPSRLGARIVNRPSRFDERILVGMPAERARRAYLERALPGDMAWDLDGWVKDTEGLSIAHLRELIAGVFCLEQEYGAVLARLKSMRVAPRERDGEGLLASGFGA
jgi:hypothetical protein